MHARPISPLYHGLTIAPLSSIHPARSCPPLLASPLYSPISRLRNLEFRGRRSFLADCQVLGRFLITQWRPRKSNRVRGFGMVFNFPVARGRFAILTLVVTSFCARSAPFFKDFGRFVLKSLKFPGAGCLEAAPLRALAGFLAAGGQNARRSFLT